jgi:hypothetical protein
VLDVRKSIRFGGKKNDLAGEVRLEVGFDDMALIGFAPQS